jgi:hypothetical protein
MWKREAAGALAHLGAVALCLPEDQGWLWSCGASAAWLITLIWAVWQCRQRRHLGIAVVISAILSQRATMSVLFAWSCSSEIRGCL